LGTLFDRSLPDNVCVALLWLSCCFLALTVISSTHQTVFFLSIYLYEFAPEDLFIKIIGPENKRAGEILESLKVKGAILEDVARS